MALASFCAEILGYDVELNVSIDDESSADRELESADADKWDRDTSLVRSGILDSLALYQLILWIEKQIGKPVRTQLNLISPANWIRLPISLTL